MNNLNIKAKQGFTLVETLVAIAVLMIAIAGPLTIANKALTSALYARDQSIASNLAQESMEIIKNNRDNIVSISASNWSTLFIDLYSTCPSDTASNNCDAGMNGNSISITSCSGCQIYLDSNNGYTHDSSLGGSRTLFSRYFYLTKVSSLDINDYQVTVVVKWNEGTTPNELRLRSELTNRVRE